MSLPANSVPVRSAALAIRRAGLALSLAALTLLGACAGPVTQVTPIDGPPPADAAYGTVMSIDRVDTSQPVTGGGAALGALIGGVVGNTFGHGFGRGGATALGAVGGAVIGNDVERNQAAANSGTHYHVVVRLDDGSRRDVDVGALYDLHVGERVHYDNGLLSPA